MLRIHLDANGLHCPCVYCDECGERIKRAADGNTLWRVDSLTGEPVAEPMAHVHKGGCGRGFESKRGGRWLWEPLTTLPVRLAVNLAIDLHAAEKTARVLSSVG